MVDRHTILNTIKETAKNNNGIPLGKTLFFKHTGIKESDWCGIHWARWSDALQEAGFNPNLAFSRIDESTIFDKLILAIRHYRKLPTNAELRLYRKRVDQNFPVATISRRFRPLQNLFINLASYIAEKDEYKDIAILCEKLASTKIESNIKSLEGFVYLIKSGNHYKVGKSNDLERRIKEIRVALPEAATLIYTIRTDDPDEIEAYWHRRFNDRRANGEWFKLERTDITAFKRRKFQ